MEVCRPQPFILTLQNHLLQQHGLTARVEDTRVNKQHQSKNTQKENETTSSVAQDLEKNTHELTNIHRACALKLDDAIMENKVVSWYQTL